MLKGCFILFVSFLLMDLGFSYEKKGDPLLDFDKSSKNHIVSSTSTVHLKPSVFAKKLSQRIEFSAKKIRELELRGFGRSEIIRFIRLYPHSKMEWKKFIKQYEKGVSLKDFARKMEIGYQKLFLESLKIRDEINTEIEKERLKKNQKKIDAEK